MCNDMYQILKDFAGPTATVIASIAARVITFILASRQVNIARQQAGIASQQGQTALDQLRYNLFEKRYAIYIKVQNLFPAISLQVAEGRLNLTYPLISNYLEKSAERSALRYDLSESGHERE